jgi:hypothetical protein
VTNKIYKGVDFELQSIVMGENAMKKGNAMKKISEGGCREKSK